MLADYGPPSPLDAGGLDDRPPLVHFGLVELSEVLRRELLARRQLVALVGKPLADRLVAQRADHGSVELGDRVLRRTLRRPHALPGIDLDAGNARLLAGPNG